jgi:hypothetical protein
MSHRQVCFHRDKYIQFHLFAFSFRWQADLFPDFQIRFLLVFARQVTARKYKRTWTDAGTLLRFCMAAGLHRNPDLIRKPTSALDKELRRRVWAAVTELELQASLDRGMLAATWPVQADCSGPSNIHDEDVQQESAHLPHSLRPTEFTHASYLSIASESIVLRHGLNMTANNIRQGLTFDDIKHFTEELELHLDNLPQWIGTSAEVPKALLQLNLRQYMLILHDRHLRQTESITERSFCRMVIMDNATRIIDTHRALINKGSHALELMCQDQLRAALSICHAATTSDISSESAIGQIMDHQVRHADPISTVICTDRSKHFPIG